jgi:hypothetical protein
MINFEEIHEAMQTNLSLDMGDKSVFGRGASEYGLNHSWSKHVTLRNR